MFTFFSAVSRHLLLRRYLVLAAYLILETHFYLYAHAHVSLQMDLIPSGLDSRLERPHIISPAQRPNERNIFHGTAKSYYQFKLKISINARP